MRVSIGLLFGSAVVVDPLAPPYRRGHAKWVRSPRGAATVSGERSSSAAGSSPSSHIGKADGKAEGDATIREPGYLAARAR